MKIEHTQSPQDLVMPALPQTITTLIYGVGALIFIFYALYLARKHKTALPVLFVFGALLTIYLEPVVDLLGNAVHPQIGQLNVLTTNGHAVPLVVLVGYVWYFAAALLMGFGLMRRRSLTGGIVWKSFAVIIFMAATVEQVPLHFGMWVYYGVQPVKIGYMPIWWMFANAAAVMVPFLLIYGLYPLLKGWKQLLVVPLIPMGAFMGHAGAGWPAYNVLGTDTIQTSRWIIEFAGIGVMFLSVFLIWVLIGLVGLSAIEKESS